MRGNLLHGAGYVLRGASLLTHPKLRLFVLVPLLINVLIFATLIALGIGYLRAQIGTAMDAIPGWLDFLSWILWPLIVIAVSLLTGYLFTALALLIASPFNALLAEKTEELVTGRPVSGLEGLGAALLGVPRGIVRELAKIAYYIPMALLVLVLSLIFSPLAPIFWFLLGAWMMSLQFIDYPMDNHPLSFADVREAARSRRVSSLGFGGLVAACTGVPIVNFFIVPAAVVGATLLWVEELAAQSATTYTRGA